MFNAFRKRTQADGITAKDSVNVSTKRQMANYFLDSLTLSHVYINMDETLEILSIVSDIRTYFERRFLFLPDLKVEVGDYITYKQYTYLATNKIESEIYPQLLAELCNTEFPYQSEERKVKDGVDNVGRPIYRIEKVITNIPCVMSDKIYSQADNSPIPLPDGNVIVKIPYVNVSKKLPKINTTVEIYQNQYQITSVSMEFVTNGVGYIEVQLQRIPTVWQKLLKKA